MAKVSILIKITFGVLLVVAGLWAISNIPIHVEKRPWTPDDLLNRPPENFTESAILSVSEPERSERRIRVAMRDYYGALYERRFADAYAFLPAELKEDMDVSEFHSWFERGIRGGRGTRVVEIGWIEAVRIGREYPVRVGDETGRGVVIEMECASTFREQEGPVQMRFMFDVWQSDGVVVQVIPGDFADLSASLDSSQAGRE